MRVLVTGSREFDDPAAVRQALVEVTAGHHGPHTLVHGGARGADTLAAIAAHRLGWQVEEHKPNWSACEGDDCKPSHRLERPDGSTYCPTAGHRRNQAMVDLGADLIVVCYKRGAGNKGTTDCRRRAEQAGIATKPVTA